MKFSNFKLEKTEGTGPIDWVFRASVDTETGAFFWKKKQRREIRRVYADFWHFVDTGEYIYGQIDALARAWTAQTGQAT